MGLNFTAPINQLGYGIAGLNLACELFTLVNESLYLHVIGGIDPNDVPIDKSATIERARLEARFYDPLAPSVRLWHEGDQALHVGRGPRYAFPFYEIDPLPLPVQHHLNLLEGLIVASDWARNVALSSGIKVPVHVVPLGVDRTIFHEEVRVDRREPDFTVFVNVGKWEYRKGHDFLLRCFNKAFTRTDKVMLRMLTRNPFSNRINEKWGTEYKTSPMGTRIQLLDRVASQADVARVMAASDIGIFPARAEGWNLDLLECLSMGLQCIATHCTAHTQYLTHDNCHLIYPTAMEVADDGVWFHGDGEWSSLGVEQEEQCIEHMRVLHRMKQSGDLRPNTVGIETAKRFSWRNSAHTLLQAIGAENGR